ncbi:hypothetical protein LVD17_03125 [Fulvivirga ulvae]|uniref:hypothetical protein n=1 Tax=Fulvivirga ulvae TaxID=2904245 RepID=UPI001F263773|nr:hypothetical protein [Fulvivirga ulvae]UII32824.1 hypothetical protein LVD17_03125 [Fulvivirga ulvae]
MKRSSPCPQKSDIVAQLQAEISRMEGFKPASNASRDTALGPVSEAFPSGSFPVGAIHNFMPARKDDATATKVSQSVTYCDA